MEVAGVDGNADYRAFENGASGQETVLYSACPRSKRETVRGKRPVKVPEQRPRSTGQKIQLGIHRNQMNTTINCCPVG
jgi:hypothetical protein